VLPNPGPARQGEVRFITRGFPPRVCSQPIEQLGVKDDGNNAPEYASTVRNGQNVSASIEPAGDVDWYWFRVEERSWVRIETSGNQGDTEIWLYGPNSSTNLLEYDDDTEPGFFSRIVRTNETALLPGTYYVKVAEYGGNNPIPAYNFTVTWGPDISDHPRLMNLAIDSDGLLRFTIEGLTNQLWVVERSTDLLSWKAISTNSSLPGRILFADPERSRGDFNFYRVAAHRR
jgi:hypothetical protein